MLAVCLLAVVHGQTAPAVTLTNGATTIHVYLPDFNTGHYVGTRFNHSGVIDKITHAGVDFVSPWLSTHDRTAHDSLCGPSDEFDTNGAEWFAATKPGDAFSKLAVGELRRPDAEPYRFHGKYDYVKPLAWSTTHDSAARRIAFVADGGSGAIKYRYRKTVSLPVEGTLKIEHELTNLADAPLETEHYCHNFFLPGGKPVGVGHSVTFENDIAITAGTRSQNAKLSGRTISPAKDLGPGEQIHVSLSVPASATKPHRFTLRTPGGLAVEQTGDRPASRIAVWGVGTTFCPEPFVAPKIAPQTTERWSNTYRFIVPAKK